MLAPIANAHEYWLQVNQTDIRRGDTVDLHAHVGEDLEGPEQIYTERSVRGFRAVHDGDVFDVETLPGGRPIGKLPRVSNGLHVAALMTAANVLTYKEWEKFAAFASSHGNDFAIKLHKERGFPDTDFKESYFRFAKTLVKVGNGEGADQSTGMPYELVALNNPFTDEGPVRLLLLFKGKPVTNHHVDVFFKPPEGETSKTVLTTNGLGEISFTHQPGLYLVNAVHLEEPNDRIVEALGVVWQSLWASLTFRVE